MARSPSAAATAGHRRWLRRSRLGRDADNQATRGAMGIQFAVTVFDPAFRRDHGSTARNHCPNYVQRPSVGEDWPNEFH